MDAFPGLPLYKLIISYGKIDARFLKDQKAGKLANESVERVNIKSKRYSYPLVPMKIKMTA